MTDGGTRAEMLASKGALCGLAAALVFGLTSAPAAATAGPVRVGAAPRYPVGARQVAALPASTKLSVLVTLRPRDPAALAAYASAVSEPGSSLFHHYLTVAQFRTRFAPSDAAVAAVETSLRSEHLDPGPVTPNGLIIPITARSDQLAGAFNTSFERVQLASGRTAYANTRAPQFDAAVSGSIQGVIGLDSLSRMQPTAVKAASRSSTRHPAAAPQVATGGPQPCAAATSAATSFGAYTADEIAGAYDFSGLYGAGDEGSGASVALFELEPNVHSDISGFESCYSGVTAAVNYHAIDGGAPGPTGGKNEIGLETELDIENVIGLAPKATVDVYQAPNTDTGVIDTYAAIVDNDTDQVVSTSWGECEAGSGSSLINEENTLFEQAATEGQSVFAASGDSGSDDCGTHGSLAVDDPASQPYVTGAGGTSLTSITGPTEVVWNDGGSHGAGGGGISLSHTMPSYQSGAPGALNVINSHSSGSPCGAAGGNYCREVPDVSASADENHGYTVYYDGAWTAVGGTSGAAPTWAALMAEVDASSPCTGTQVGFANPALYAAAASDYSGDFNDITSGNNDYNGTALFPAGTGYDMASGLGSPEATALASSLCAAATNTVTVTNPGNQTGTVGTAVNLQIKATDTDLGQTLTYSATGLPPGLSINSSSGLISGSPTTAVSIAVTVKATDTTSASGSTSFAWTVNPAPNTVTVTNPGSQTGTVGTAVNLQIKATDSDLGQTLTYSASGLPAGVSINSSSGLITGTPTTAWSGNVTVEATDATTASGSTSFSWKVTAPQETLTVTKSGPGSGAITSSPAGISCGPTCSHAYTKGTTVTLTAAPAGGSSFTGWSGACSGTGTCSITMDTAASANAMFGLRRFCLVPKVTGLKLKAARGKLKRASCRTGKVTHRHSRTKKGHVITQTPRPKRHLPDGAKVSLVVSSGKRA